MLTPLYLPYAAEPLLLAHRPEARDQTTDILRPHLMEAKADPCADKYTSNWRCRFVGRYDGPRARGAEIIDLTLDLPMTWLANQASVVSPSGGCGAHLKRYLNSRLPFQRKPRFAPLPPPFHRLTSGLLSARLGGRLQGADRRAAGAGTEGTA